MNYIFLDMEWNQPNGKANTVMSTVPLHGEIIRIGAVKSADGTTLSDKFYSCVIPRYYKKMNYAVGRVTGLGTAAMTYGVKFTLAYEQFLEWCGEDCIILTWGGEDEKILEANLAVHGMDMKAHPKFCDLQIIFARRILCDGRQHSLQSAVEHYGIEMNLRAHDALNDAYYAACVGLKMGFADYLTQYADMIAEAERIRSEKYFRTYQNIRSASEAMYGRRIRTCRCPVQAADENRQMDTHGAEYSHKLRRMQRARRIFRKDKGHTMSRRQLFRHKALCAAYRRIQGKL